MSTRKARLAGVLHPLVSIVALNVKPPKEDCVKNAPPLTNSIQMLRKDSEGDGESKTTKPECAHVLKNCSI